MSAGQVRVYPGTLFDYTAGVYCGVLVSEQVMKKLAKLQAEHVEKVKRVLTDNLDGVFPSMWTLHYPEGKQKIVKYIDESANVLDCINRAVTHPRPVPHFPVFVARSMDQARMMADAHHAGVSV